MKLRISVLSHHNINLFAVFSLQIIIPYFTVLITFFLQKIDVIDKCIASDMEGWVFESQPRQALVVKQVVTAPLLNARH